MKKSIYLGDAATRAARELGATVEQGERADGLSPALNWCAAAYLEVTARSLPRLPREQWEALLHATNGVAELRSGHSPSAAAVPADLLGNVAAVGDAASRALLDSLRGMTYAEQLACWHLAARFWADERPAMSVDDAVPAAAIADAGSTASTQD